VERDKSESTLSVAMVIRTYDDQALFNTYEAASEAREKVQDAANQVAYMKQDIERLLMITEALDVVTTRIRLYRGTAYQFYN
jgi:hypothetical protein